jgi:hypothetical protein
MLYVNQGPLAWTKFYIAKVHMTVMYHTDGYLLMPDDD